MISDFWWHLQTLIYERRHDKTNKTSMRLAKTQISLGIRPVWSESSLCAQWVAKSQSYHHADSDDSDQAGRMPRLIWVYTGRTDILLVLSCRGSYLLTSNLMISCVDLFRHVRIYDLNRTKNKTKQKIKKKKQKRKKQQQKTKQKTTTKQQQQQKEKKKTKKKQTKKTKKTKKQKKTKKTTRHIETMAIFRKIYLDKWHCMHNLNG